MLLQPLTAVDPHPWGAHQNASWPSFSVTDADLASHGAWLPKPPLNSVFRSLLSVVRRVFFALRSGHCLFLLHMPGGSEIWKEKKKVFSRCTLHSEGSWSEMQTQEVKIVSLCLWVYHPASWETMFSASKAGWNQILLNASSLIFSLENRLILLPN